MADRTNTTITTMQGSYRICKEDTNTFLTWVAQTAQSRGHIISNTELGPNAKRKAKEYAQADVARDKITNVRQLRLQDFTACAEAIVQARNPKVTLSPSILAKAHRALALRKRFAAWFENVKQDNEATVCGNQSHQYFNHWFEQLLLLLKPCCDAFLVKEEGAPPTQPTSNNIFTLLELEEPTIEDIPASEPAIEQTSSSKGDSVEYTVEDNKQEKYIAIFCLCEDLNRLRREIYRMWKSYRLGEADLVSVAVATNAALEHGTSIEAELRKSYRGLDTCHKIANALLCLLDLPTVDHSAIFVRHTDVSLGVSISKPLIEWLILPTITATKYVLEVHPDDLAGWAAIDCWEGQVTNISCRSTSTIAEGVVVPEPCCIVLSELQEPLPEHLKGDVGLFLDKSSYKEYKEP